jgi:hypothetical protein
LLLLLLLESSSRTFILDTLVGFFVIDNGS